MQSEYESIHADAAKHIPHDARDELNFSAQQPHRMQPTILGYRAKPARLRFSGGALLAAMILCIVAAHIGLAATYVSSIPYSDEWDAVIALPLKLLAEGRYSLWELLRPHNEHTIVPTRLVSVLALWLNHGQFDNVPVVLLNALLIAGVWAVPVFLFYRHASGHLRIFAFVLSLIGLAPIEGADTLIGFQNQYYFLIVSSIAVLWLAASTQATSKRSLCAYAATALAACVSMGSGFFAPLLAAVIGTLRAIREPDHRRGLSQRVALALIAAGLGLGLLLHTGLVHSKQIDLAAFQRALSCLAWPYTNSAWAGVLVSLPFLAFALRVVWRRATTTPLDYLALALGIWAGAQIWAVAFERHIDGASIMSRYLSVVVFWPLMNVYGLARLVEPYFAQARLRLLAALPAVAAVALIGCIVLLVPGSLAAIALGSKQHVQQVEHIAGYVRTGDPAALYGAGHMQLPYPDIPRLKSLLDDPEIRRGLPADIRAPMPMEAELSDARPAFVAHGVYPTTTTREDLPDLGSYTGSGNANTGTYHSRPMQTAFPFVDVGVAGYLPDSALSLKLVCASSEPCNATTARPTEAARESWQELLLKVPQSNFRLLADDRSSNLWFAFSPPLEVGALSAHAVAFIKLLRNYAMTWLALVAAILILLLLRAVRLNPRPPSGET